MFIKEEILYESTGEMVPYVQTPNINGRLAPLPNRFVILHFTASGSLPGTVGWFSKRTSNVSAHLLISRNGSVVQMARLADRCWHAGRSRWGDVKGLNSYAVGVELINWGGLKRVDGAWQSWTDAVVDDDDVFVDQDTGDGWQRYPAAQLDACFAVCRALQFGYDIPTERFLGHADVAPRRKVDPGPAFPMVSLRDHLQPPDPSSGTVERRSGLDRRQPVAVDAGEMVRRAFERY